LNWWVRQTSETEIHVVAVERLKEYADVDNEVSSYKEKLSEFPACKSRANCL